MPAIGPVGALPQRETNCTSKSSSRTLLRDEKRWPCSLHTRFVDWSEFPDRRCPRNWVDWREILGRYFRVEKKWDSGCGRSRFRKSGSIFMSRNYARIWTVVFSAGTDSLDVWCVIEKEKSYQKLVRLLQRVRGSHEVYLYTTRPEKKEKTPDDRDPPPSFWNNDELRDYLRDPFARDRRSPVGSDFDSEAPHEIFFKQRLRLYADSLLESKQRIARYVMDLPELATAGSERTVARSARSRRVVSACPILSNSTSM